MPSPTLLDRAERRFGHLAISGLLHIVASFQALCFVILYIRPDYANFLALTPAAWEQGEIWRLFTFCFIPRSLSVMWIIFVIMLLLSISKHLEAHWGKFRLNLYFGATVVCLWIAIALGGPIFGIGVGLEASTMLYSSIFLAFATVVPDYSILVYMILPAKAKWLAWLDGAWLAYLFLTVSYLRLPIVIALLPYACFAVPILRRNLRNANRRAEFKANSLPQGEAFHECSVCHRTDHTNPTLEFRVAADDREYCVEHLPR